MVQCVTSNVSGECECSVNVTETETVDNQCNGGTLANQEKERPTSTFNSISNSAMTNNKRTNEDTDSLLLDDVDNQPKEDEWDNFGQFIALIMRSMQSDARRTRMKMDVMKVLQKYKQEDLEYSKQLHLNNVNKT